MTAGKCGSAAELTTKSLAAAAAVLSTSLTFQACKPLPYEKQKSQSESPNILWMVMDHVTFHHYRETTGPLPTLDTYERLAREGIEFERAYSIQPLCSPARASMLTGKFSINHGIYTNAGDQNNVDLMRSTPMWNQYMKMRGYATGYFGKVHAGIGSATTNANGFTGWGPEGYGDPYRSGEYKSYVDRNGWQTARFHLEWGILNSEKGRVFDMAEVDNWNGPSFNGAFRALSSGYFTNPEGHLVHEADFVVSLAMDYMDQCIANKKKFIVSVNPWGPHQPFQVPEETKGSVYTNRNQIPKYPNFDDGAINRPLYVREYLNGRKDDMPGINTWNDWQPIMARAYEAYAYIDMALGRLLDYLDEKGLSENTLVILTADHGDELGSHGGLIDKAGSLSEEVSRIPLVIRWPGKITPGTKTRALVSNIDITPTILEAGGYSSIPPGMDGKSLMPVFRGNESRFNELLLFHFGHANRWYTQRALYYGDYKYLASRADNGSFIVHELYNLADDPFELINLMDNPSEKTTALDMVKRMLSHMNRVGDNRDVKGTLQLRTAIQNKITELEEGV